MIKWQTRFGFDTPIYWTLKHTTCYYFFRPVSHNDYCSQSRSSLRWLVSSANSRLSSAPGLRPRKVEVRVMLLPMFGRSVGLSVVVLGTHLGPWTDFYYSQTCADFLSNRCKARRSFDFNRKACFKFRSSYLRENVARCLHGKQSIIITGLKTCTRPQLVQSLHKLRH